MRTIVRKDHESEHLSAKQAAEKRAEAASEAQEDFAMLRTTTGTSSTFGKIL
jgi:hypothetical protein